MATESAKTRRIVVAGCDNQMVDRDQVKLGVAIAIFEDARSPEVMECYRNQN